jgi:cell division protein FtsB
VEECQLYIRKLQSEKDALAAKITGLEKELKRLNSREIPDSGIIDKQARTIEVGRSCSYF